MRSTAAFASVREPELFTPPQLNPWDYIRLRREAAGLSIEQVACRFFVREEHRPCCEANLRTFEMPNVVVKRIEDLDLPRAFPFDPVVYRQLAELPADRQPKICRSCGWDQWAQQVDRNGDDCTWSEGDPTICTRCEQLSAEKAR